MLDSFVAVFGPTGGGKARIAIELAKRTNALLISCDSMKIYKLMDIGTAKPSPEIQAQVDWRVIDCVWPWQHFDAQNFVELATSAIQEARQAGRPVIVSGGTSLYLKALTEGLFEGPGQSPELRARLEAEAEQQGSHALHERLKQVDPERAEKLHPNDLRRIVRALEVFELTGQTLSSQQQQFGKLKDGLRRRLFFVKRQRQDMDERINQRVDRMMDHGWLDECRNLKSQAQELTRGPLQAIGYQQLFDYIEREHQEQAPSLEDTVTDIKTKTRRFARRQITWLKHFPDAQVLELEAGQSATAEQFTRLEAAVQASLTELLGSTKQA